MICEIVLSAVKKYWDKKNIISEEEDKSFTESMSKPYLQHTN